MYINNYFIIFLYLLSILFYIGYFILKNVPDHYVDLKKKENHFLFWTVLGLLLSYIIGFLNDAIPSDNSKVDFQRIINFSLIFIVPIVLSKMIFFKSPKFKLLFHLVLFVFLVFVSISLLLKGGGESAFFGNLFGATTVSLGIVSIIIFSGIEYYYKDGRKLGLIISIVGYTISIASLVKWNLIVDIIAPILIFKVWRVRTKFSQLSKVIFVLSFMVVIIFFAFIVNDLFNLFAKINDFESINTYIQDRVLRQQHTASNFESGILVSFGEYGIKDGGRLLIWRDLLNRTFADPLLGIGLGARAFDFKGWGIEDHNFIIFFLARFGILIFSFFSLNLIRTIKAFYNITKDENYPASRLIYLSMIINFFFQAFFGNIWGQLPVVLVLGFVLHFFTYPQNEFENIETRTINV